MFEQFPRREISHSWALKSLAFSAAGIGIGFGLCGAGLFMPQTDGLGIISTIGLAVFSLGWLGIAVSIIAMLGIWIINKFRT